MLDVCSINCLKNELPIYKVQECFTVMAVKVVGKFFFLI